MCGICGKMNFDRSAKVDAALLYAMADSIQHRGPDDDGYYLSGNIGLGFRRLSIIDLNSGHQPLANEDESVWVVFNGEIYNYQELRADLLQKGHVFKTHSDTEVLVHLYEEYGPELLQKLRGMFAFCIWDDKEKQLLLARDRVGIKPLYYYLDRSFITFGSEIKSILADPKVDRKVNLEMIDRFLTFYYLPGEETLFSNIFKLAPGSYLIAKDGRVRLHRYWDLEFTDSDYDLQVENAEEKLIALLEETTRLHMISDVPVGFLLSGGVDSTALLSFAAGKTQFPISSFTVGFAESGVVDERSYARLAADRFGTQHYEMTISAADFAGFLPNYVKHMEEPVCEPPAVALYYVSKLAREHVKVLISGEGGDEAFAGYSNYRNLVWLEKLKGALGPLKTPTKSVIESVNKLAKLDTVKKYTDLFDLPVESYYYSRTSLPNKIFNSDYAALYASALLPANKARSLSPVQDFFRSTTASETLNKMLYVDTKTWLPDDLLVKADKMTMANSVELRVPFLDHKVLEFAASLPPRFKLNGITTKYLAKRALSTRVPKEILSRKKAGFPVPYESWLRKDLNGFVRDVVLDRRALDRGYFNRKALAGLLDDNQGSGRFAKEIFSLTVLELWHRVFLDVSSVTSAAQSLPVKN